LTENPNVFFF